MQYLGTADEVREEECKWACFISHHHAAASHQVQRARSLRLSASAVVVRLMAHAHPHASTRTGARTRAFTHARPDACMLTRARTHPVLGLGSKIEERLGNEGKRLCKVWIDKQERAAVEGMHEGVRLLR